MPRPLHRSVLPRSEAAFTLVELVLAIALLGGTFLGLLYLRVSAVETAARCDLDRRVQRIAQEKLDEVVYGVETMTSGSIDDLEGWTWEVEVYSPEPTESLFPLLECNLTLHHPGIDRDEMEDYRVTSRFFADENHPLRQYADLGTQNSSSSSSTGGL